MTTSSSPSVVRTAQVPSSVLFSSSFDQWVKARQAIDRLPRPNDEDPLQILLGQYSHWLTANQVEVQLHDRLKDLSDEDLLATFAEQGVPSAIQDHFLWRRHHWQTEYCEHQFDGRPPQFGATLYIPAAVFQWPKDQYIPIIPMFLKELEDRLTLLFRALVQKNVSQYQPNLLSVPLLDDMGWPNLPYMQWSGMEVNRRVPPAIHTTLQGCLVSLPLEAYSAAELATLEDLTRAVMDQILKEDWGHFKYMGLATSRAQAMEETSLGMSMLWARMVLGSSAGQRGEAEFVIESGQGYRVRAAVRIKDLGSEKVVGMFNQTIILQEKASLGRLIAPWLSTSANHLSFQISTTPAATMGK